METNRNTDSIEIKIVPNTSGRPAAKLADAEIWFVGNSPLSGLKLIGFSVWERRTRLGRNVMFPARQYTVNGERRSFILLRPSVETGPEDALRDRILAAYAEFERASSAER